MKKLLCTYVYFAAFASLGMSIASLGPCLLYLAEQTDSSLSAMGFVFVARSIGYLCSSIVSGALVDRLPAHPLLTFFLVLATAGTAVTPFLPKVWMLGVAVSMQGIAMGGLDTAANVSLIRIHGASVGPYMQAMHFFFALGATISPLIVKLVEVDENGNHSVLLWPFWVFSAFHFACAVPLFFLTSPRKSQTEEEDATNTKVQEEKQSLLRFLPSDNAEQVVLLLTSFLMCVYVGAEVAFGGFIHAFAVKYLQTSEKVGHDLTAVFWGFLALGRLASVGLALVTTARIMLLMDVVGCVVASLGLLLLDHRISAVWVLTALYGISMASVFPSAVTMVEDYMEVTGAIASLFVVGAALGEMALPLLVAQLFTSQQFGPYSFLCVIFVSAVVVVATLLLLLLVGRSTRRYSASHSNSNGEASDISDAEAKVSQLALRHQRLDEEDQSAAV